MNRRQFIRQAAIAAVAPAIIPTALAAVPMAGALNLDLIFEQLYRLRRNRGPEITILVGNPTSDNDWVYRQWYDGNLHNA